MDHLEYQASTVENEGFKRVPKILKEVSRCILQILWSPEEKPTGFICSKLSIDMRTNIREIVHMIFAFQFHCRSFQNTCNHVIDKYQAEGLHGA